ncbi:hypothetical protein HOY82DRAFT_614838 [Tuber indicum]|nr:hypothetical protein HOY82DRAFT_614838 [Tuber indicum]
MAKARKLKKKVVREKNSSSSTLKVQRGKKQKKKEATSGEEETADNSDDYAIMDLDEDVEVSEVSNHNSGTIHIKRRSARIASCIKV